MPAIRHFATPLATLCLLHLATAAHADPRHIFLTYSGAPETTIDINVIMNGASEPVYVFYDSEPRHEDRDTYRHVAQAQYLSVPMELSDGRRLHVARLTGLAPGTTYSFVAGEAVDGYSRELKFRTLPGGDAPVRFVNGGDMGVDGRAERIQRVAGSTNPDFSVIGGDIAYANGYLAQDDLWDTWLDHYMEYMQRPDGCMIPIMTAIGNHEVNKFASDDPMIRSPWYLSLFGRQGEKPYYSRAVGDKVVFFFLDSNHLNPVDGTQAAWLAAELEKYKEVPVKFAVYHVPMYPAFGGYDGSVATRQREVWGPLFDKYGVRVAFEHHDHVAKRSKPLKDGKVTEDGTVYVGDGAFGRESRDVDRELRWYNAMEVSTVHFWQVDVSEEGLKLQAINRQEEVFDSFTLP